MAMTPIPNAGAALLLILANICLGCKYKWVQKYIVDANIISSFTMLDKLLFSMNWTFAR